MPPESRAAAIQAFISRWQERGSERKDAQPFWLSLLGDVFEVKHPAGFISFEDTVQLSNKSFIDARIPSTKVLIEQKGSDVDLSKAFRQSDGTWLTPYEQADRYGQKLSYSERPRWIVVCNFKEFHIYDKETPEQAPEIVYLKDLAKDAYRLAFLIDGKTETAKKELEISFKAGRLVGKLYDLLIKQYADAKSAKSLQSLNRLCVRLVFCLYAEDTGIFPERNMFGRHLHPFDAGLIRQELKNLFCVLNTPESERSPYETELNRFPYVNGGLFAADDLEIPNFTQEIKEVLTYECSERFDWSFISPTIFGAIFESTLNPETRRSGGMHYTSIENIHKVIDPLFLDDLKNELSELRMIKKRGPKFIEKVNLFRDKIRNLTFLDPACGSGNFLTETYLSLRKIENEIIKLRGHEDQYILFKDAIHVQLKNFYGIEINDFAVSVAKTALWIAEHQMLRETEKIINRTLDFLPLTTNAHIVEGNALTLDWVRLKDEALIPTIHAEQTNLFLGSASRVSEPPIVYSPEVNLHTNKLCIGKQEETTQPVHYDYIISNPPFVGASMMSAAQKREAIAIFGKIKRASSIDYVGAWYYKAAALMIGTNTKAAFVSTNSITQGEQVAPLWGKLIDQYKVQIIFAHRTFKWDSESSQKAAVHCVIIGFVAGEYSGTKKLYEDAKHFREALEINPYLVEAPSILVSSRSKSVCNSPKMTYGNKPADGGHLILSEEERSALVCNDASIEPLIRRYVGARDFINNDEVRYCLWLNDVPANQYRHNREIMRRLQAVREVRLKSTAAPTREMAAMPYRFFSITQTNSRCLAIPEVSSERRLYIPMDFLGEHEIASNKLLIIPEADLFSFGILISRVHMAWIRAVSGRLKSDYQYSGAIVYNNFPWPNPTDALRQKIELTAQGILDARSFYPDSSLAALYDPLTMPKELQKAHQKNDAAVLQTYGFSKNMGEPEIVAGLMQRYQRIVEDLS